MANLTFDQIQKSIHDALKRSSFGSMREMGAFFTTHTSRGSKLYGVLKRALTQLDHRLSLRGAEVDAWNAFTTALSKGDASGVKAAEAAMEATGGKKAAAKKAAAPKKAAKKKAAAPKKAAKKKAATPKKAAKKKAATPKKKTPPKPAASRRGSSGRGGATFTYGGSRSAEEVTWGSASHVAPWVLEAGRRRPYPREIVQTALEKGKNPMVELKARAGRVKDRRKLGQIAAFAQAAVAAAAVKKGARDAFRQVELAANRSLGLGAPASTGAPSPALGTKAKAARQDVTRADRQAAGHAAAKTAVEQTLQAGLPFMLQGSAKQVSGPVQVKFKLRLKPRP